MSSGWVNERDTLTEFCNSREKCHISIFCGHKVQSWGGGWTRKQYCSLESMIPMREAFFIAVK